MPKVIQDRIIVVDKAEEIKNHCLQQLIVHYQRWQGGRKSLNKIQHLLTSFQDLPNFIDIVSAFKHYLEHASHPKRFKRTPLFLDSYRISETDRYKELLHFVNSFLPKPSMWGIVTGLTATFVQTTLSAPKKLYSFVINHPEATVTTLLPLLPTAKAQSSLSTHATLQKQMVCDDSGRRCVADSLCDARLALPGIPGRQITYTCSDSAKAYYAMNPTLYDADVSHLHAAMTDISQHKVTRCKLEQLLETEERFHINFLTINEFPSPTIAGMYNTTEVNINFPVEVINSQALIITAEHETHHAWVANTNKFFKHNYVPSLDVSGPSPIRDTYPDDATNLKHAFEKGQTRLLDHFTIINKMKDGEKLTDSENMQLSHYLKITKKITYQHKDFRMYQPIASIATLTKMGILDQQGNFLKEFIYPQNISLGDTTIQINLRVYGVEIKDGFLVLKFDTVVEPEDKPFAPIYDGLFSLANTKNLRGQRETEMDAYVIETYEKHNDLYRYFFKELRNFHSRRATETYSRCVS